MYTLEAALVQQWCHKAMSEEELMRSADLGKVFRRTAIGFALFAMLIFGLSWAGDLMAERPQVATADHLRPVPQASY